jgi:tripartite-type tricarboxylate transporter receptor subunit TctC
MNLVYKLLVVLTGAVLLLAHPDRLAQAYPNKPIRLVSAFPAGGGNDVLARIVAAKLAENLGQPVIVENRVGASGNIGASYVAKSPPDGYTLLFANNTIVSNPAIGKVPFDVLMDFVPVGMVGSTATAIAVHPSVPATNMQQLLELLAKNPGKFSYSSCGAGTTMHLVAELMKQQAKLDVAHVAYRGCAPALADGLAGHVPILFNTYSNVRAAAAEGKLRVLAFTSPRRSSLAPTVPTLGEVSPQLRDVLGETWSGVLAPAGVPPSIVQKLNTELNAVLSMPDVRSRLEATSTEVQPMTPAQVGELMRGELERWTRLVRETGMVIQQ